MAKRVENSLLLPLSLSLLIITLFQSSCGKDPDYMSREEFISYMSGKWQVFRIAYYDHPVDQGRDIVIYRWDDGITYEFNHAGDPTFYSFDDPTLCTLEGIEFIQDWTISQINHKLILKTSDQCGDTNTFTMECKNYEHPNCSEDDMGQTLECHDLYADITLINENDSIVLHEFYFYTDDLWMEYLIPDNSSDPRHKRFYIEKTGE